MEKNKLKNKIRSYWNKRPCNINHSKSKFLTKKYFNEVSKKRYFVESHIPKFAEFKKYKNKNVLEIGFGIGTDAFEFIKNGANYYGIEFSERSYDIAKKRAEVFGLNKIKSVNFFKGDAENLTKIQDLKKVKFDLIYSFGVLHHTPDIKKCFNEIYKIANSRTIIKIMLYAKNSYKNYLVENKINKIRYEAQKGCPVVKKVDDSDLKKIISKKFEILSMSQDFIFPYKISDYKKNKFTKIKHFQYMPKKIFSTLEEKLGEHLLITLKSKKNRN